VLLAINIWFAIAHKRTKNVLLVSILFGVFWAFYWYSQQFLTWCA
jgi:glucose uptake protein GlcU